MSHKIFSRSVATLAVISAQILPALAPALALADEVAAPVAPAGAPAAAAGQPGLFGMFFPFVAMFGVIYFMMIRPQQKKMKEQQEMLTALKLGDDVVTTSGVLGKIKGVNDKIVTLEIDTDVQVKMLKSQIAQVLKGQSVKELA